jgi:hypothetical protein
VLRYAKLANPTFANFNIVTPYPGTEFFEQIKEQISNFDYTQYNVYTPVLRYQNMTAEDVHHWHAKCFTRYYFRWEWLCSQGPLVWPWLKLLGIGWLWPWRKPEDSTSAVEPAPAVAANAAAPQEASTALPIIGQSAPTASKGECATHGPSSATVKQRDAA